MAQPALNPTLKEQAAAILRANDRGGYTVPSASLYPFQWNWDSGFAAMGFATFDEPRAWQELALLLRGQWADGMVPHIVFQQPAEGYYPGPDVWEVAHEPPTSGITQPPILGTAAHWIWQHATDREGADAAARALYPKLLAYQRWFHEARDPAASGLVATLHPWESGMDNSPAWDAPLKAVPIDPLPAYERADLQHVDAAQRPRRADYDRYLTLVLRFRKAGYAPARTVATSPFRLVDLATNAILLRADQDLLALARALDIGDGQEALAAWIERGKYAFERLWSEPLGRYQGLDLITGRPLDASTSAQFLPLFARVASAEQARRLGEEIARWGEQVRYLMPSADPAGNRYEPTRYWRGPVWLIVNWMIADGLATYGQHDLAARLREDCLALVRQGGFCEYFSPATGEGLGGERFTWTAACVLMAG